MRTRGDTTTAASSADPAGQLLVARTPMAFRPVPGGFETWATGRGIVEVSGTELLVLASWTRPRSRTDHRPQYDAWPAAWRPSPRVAEAAIARTLELGILEAASGSAGTRVRDAEERQRREGMQRTRRLVSQMERAVAERGDRRRARGDERTPVLTVQHPRYVPNLALGMILSYAARHEGGRLTDRYDLEPNWLVAPATIAELLDERGPGVFLFSNYVWSLRQSLAMSRRIKELSPDSITIHGGPATPRYAGDAEQFLLDHPHVDIIIRNEGEVATAEVLAALDGRLEGGSGRFAALADVPGLCFRLDGQVVRTPDRDRLADLSILPSPYLDGTFEDYEGTMPAMAIVETVRGCPYGCTFCDWGSDTKSRLRKFPLDRVFAEIEWAARNQVEWLFLADANFGILPRDVEIAEHVASLRRLHGFPREFSASYAKNTGKHLRQIISILARAGLTNNGALALQSTDDGTLDAVERSNIRVEKYLELADTFRKERLPLYTELMLGLPGATVESFRDDLQFVCDQEVVARIHRTELLVNSPMNDPAYRERWQIRTGAGHPAEMVVDPTRDSLLVSTSSYTEDDLEEMLRMRLVFRVLQNNSVLRHVTRFVRHETGLSEVEVHDRIDAVVRADQEAFPSVAWVLDSFLDFTYPPLDWSLFFAEVRELVVRHLGVEPSSALDVVLAVQQAVLPGPDRRFPDLLSLQHDYAAWYAAVVQAKGHGSDWRRRVPPLASYGPALFEIDDPDDICGRMLGANLHNPVEIGWELASAVSARRVGRGRLACRRWCRRGGRSEPEVDEGLARRPGVHDDPEHHHRVAHAPEHGQGIDRAAAGLSLTLTGVEQEYRHDADGQHPRHLADDRAPVEAEEHAIGVEGPPHRVAADPGQGQHQHDVDVEELARPLHRRVAPAPSVGGTGARAGAAVPLAAPPPRPTSPAAAGPAGRGAGRGDGPRCASAPPVRG